MELTVLEALEVTTIEVREYVDEQPVVSYGEKQNLNKASRMTAKNNLGVYVGPDEPMDALDGDIWVEEHEDSVIAFKLKKDGAWLGEAIQEMSDPLPEVTEEDNGSFLRVVNGAWATATIANAEGVVF